MSTALIAGLRDLIETSLPASTNRNFILGSLEYCIYVSKQTDGMADPIREYVALVADVHGLFGNKIKTANIGYLKESFSQIEQECVAHGLLELSEIDIQP